MKKQFTIKIDRAARGRIEEVANKITRIGAKIDKKMAKIGVISATMEENLEPKVRVVDDVQMVRLAKTYSVAPPDASAH